MKNVILIGFMGAGKTTVGERYGEKHGLPMVDTDWLIEERAGMTAYEIGDICAEGRGRVSEDGDGGSPDASFRYTGKGHFRRRRASPAGRE